MANLQRGMDRESPWLLFEKWRFAEGNVGNIHMAKKLKECPKTHLEAFFSKPYQRENQEQNLA